MKHKRGTASEADLRQIVDDPIKRSIYHEVMSAITQLAATKIDAATRHLRSSAGGIARKKKISPKRRKEIAKKAVEARWNKRKERPLKQP